MHSSGYVRAVSVMGIFVPLLALLFVAILVAPTLRYSLGMIGVARGSRFHSRVALLRCHPSNGLAESLTGWLIRLDLSSNSLRVFLLLNIGFNHRKHRIAVRRDDVERIELRPTSQIPVGASPPPETAMACIVHAPGAAGRPTKAFLLRHEDADAFERFATAHGWTVERGEPIDLGGTRE